MKKLSVLMLLCCFTLCVSLAGCGGGDPNAGGSAPPTEGLDNGAGEEEDPNAGVGFDDPTMGKDGA